ncbi:DUF6933 domain-containing protein [Companilactobacillus sp. FL22-1]|uniref:DUF6933 domain-containing protein n=1 Tax=Companilactobacillus sp. FL22-1 TaxID=3373892 RepID=UPI0037543843
MFINVVQKAQSLFKDYPMKEDKQTALANPVFSWHVKYLTYNRKKVVIFSHDASTLTVVIFDVNAKNRSQMKARFEEQLAEVCQNMGISQATLNEYLKTAGDWQIGPTVNRSQVGHLNEVSMVVEQYLDANETDEVLLSNDLTSSVRNLDSDNFVHYSSVPEALAVKNLVWHKAKVNSKKVDNTHLQDICKKLKEAAVTAKKYSSSDDYEKIDQQIITIGNLNDELIASFSDYLKDDYSKKTVKSHQNMLKLYLNEYLAYHLKTLFDDDASSVGDLYFHGSSMTEVKQVQRSMNKLYQFLAQQGLIDGDFVKEMKELMKSSIW